VEPDARARVLVQLYSLKIKTRRGLRGCEADPRGTNHVGSVFLMRSATSIPLFLLRRYHSLRGAQTNGYSTSNSPLPP
jgi:hypothetical protein